MPFPIAIALTPAGHLLLRPADPGEASPEPALANRIEEAFARGHGAGLLHLGAAEAHAALPSAFAFWRDLGRAFVAALCALPDVEEQRERAEVLPAEAGLQRLLLAAPPMRGAEYLGLDVLESLWAEMLRAWRAEITGWRGPVQAWLAKQDAAWSLVGRVHLHVAENKRDPERPFAFLASYTTGLAPNGKPQHRPLGEVVRAASSELTPEALARHDLVAVTYGSVHRFAWLRDATFGLAVLDEAQAVKNPVARQTRAVKSIRSRLRLALTGTPVENRAGDLWSIFDFVNPGLLGTAKEFGAFVKAAEAASRAPAHDGVDHPSPYGALRELVRPYILRRLKTDRAVIADLPEKTEVKAYCPLARRQAALYEEAVEGLARDVKAMASAGAMERRGLVLAYLLRLKQICIRSSAAVRSRSASTRCSRTSEGWRAI